MGDALLTARHHAGAHHLLRVYLACAFRRSFSGVYFSDASGGTLPGPDDDVQLVVAPNHPSWWDGFLGYELVRRVFRRTFFVMMDRPELSARPFFRRVGAFSVVPGSPSSARRSFAYLRAVLERPVPAAALVFPEGVLTPERCSDYRFRRGLTLLRGTDRQVVIVPVRIDFGFGDRPKPSAFVTAGVPLPLARYLEDPDLLVAAAVACRDAASAPAGRTRWKAWYGPAAPPAPFAAPTGRWSAREPGADGPRE